jgi:deferrochelatase/peroxidase EfeB
VNPSRRNFLRGAISGAAGTALAGGVLIGGAKADADAATAASGADGQATEPSYPFHGAGSSPRTPPPSSRSPASPRSTPRQATRQG